MAQVYHSPFLLLFDVLMVFLSLWIGRWTAQAYATGSCLQIDPYNLFQCQIPGSNGIQGGSDLCVNVRSTAKGHGSHLMGPGAFFLGCKSSWFNRSHTKI